MLNYDPSPCNASVDKVPELHGRSVATEFKVLMKGNFYFIPIHLPKSNCRSFRLTKILVPFLTISACYLRGYHAPGTASHCHTVARFANIPMQMIDPFFTKKRTSGEDLQN